MHTEQLLENYYKACNDMVDRFINLLFEGEYVERDWIAGDVSGVLNFGDYFANMEMIQYFFEYNMTAEEWFKYYDWEMDIRMQNETPLLNLKNWLLAERTKFKK